jgi:ABC-type multidrug transport system fused ATPase/permease subunit
LLGGSSSTPDYFTTCSWWSYLFFSFPFPLLKLGNSRVLGLSDLPPAPASCKPELLVARFQRAWEAQQLKTSNAGKRQRRQHSIRRALWSCLWKDVGITACFAFLKGMGVLSGPIFLYLFVDYASSSSEEEEEGRWAGEGVALVAFIAVMKLMENVAQRHWYFGVRVIAGKMQSIMMAAVYAKELRLSSAGRRRHGVGEIVNYVTVDVNRLAELSWRLHWAWLVAVILAGAMGIAWAVVGAAALPAGAIVVLVLLLMPPLITSMQRSQLRLMSAQDERLRRTTELLHGIKVVKLQAWEHGFRSSIAAQRGAEFAHLSQTQRKRSHTTVVYWVMPTVLSCVVLGATLLLGTASLTSTVVFTVLATFRIVQDPVRMTPEVLAAFIQAHISFDRLETFLQEEELADDAHGDDDDHRSAHPPASFPIRVDDATLSWAPDDAAVPALASVNLVVKRGEKVAVCGAVGSGKSSLLLALLGEIPKLSGSVQNRNQENFYS